MQTKTTDLRDHFSPIRLQNHVDITLCWQVCVGELRHSPYIASAWKWWGKQRNPQEE